MEGRTLMTPTAPRRARWGKPMLLASALCALAMIATGCDSEKPTRETAPPATEEAHAETSRPHTHDTAKGSERPPDLEPAALKTTPVAGAPATFADLVERARPAVINIYTKVRVPNRRLPSKRYLPFAPRERVAESLGSGFIIDANGLALTNHHVVQNATEIEVRLLDERRFKAEIIGEDPKTDLALIQIDADDTELPYLPLGDSDALRVGDWVVAIGNPLGLTSTVTAGITSATGRRDVPLGEEMVYQDFIQTDASINPGNSGGPLLNMKGDVVGINTAISAQAQGIGFAIPMNMIKEILPDLKEDGRVKRSWLGIYVDEVPAQLASNLGVEREGALVMNVVPGGPADLARLEQGDIILELGDEKIKDASQLSWIAGHTGIGKIVEVELLRGDKRMKTRLKMGALPD